MHGIISATSCVVTSTSSPQTSHGGGLPLALSSQNFQSVRELAIKGRQQISNIGPLRGKFSHGGWRARSSRKVETSTVKMHATYNF